MIRKLKISCWGTEIRKLKKSFSCTFWTSYSRGLYTHSAKKSLLKDIVKAKVQKKKNTKTKAFNTFMDCDLQNQTDMPIHTPYPQTHQYKVLFSPPRLPAAQSTLPLICKKINDFYSLHWNWHHYWLLKFSEEQSIIFTQDYLNIMAFSSFMVLC